ncbi:unnamed protein product [Lymnaea stagnalis]|uniref:LolA-like domain-containing protein n=1 Tax=Lymnaea stagnalis TaxID=6523 RepID=A0AAV2GZ79_LYMST
MKFTILPLLSLVVCLVDSQAPTPTPACKEYNSASADPGPLKMSSDFSVDIETVSVETGRVTNMLMYYSTNQNMIRLNMFQNGQKSDMYFYFDDNEILAFDYSTGGRGSCKVLPNLNTQPDTFIVGGSKTGGKIEVPLAVLHFTGQSGFGGSIIEVGQGFGAARGMETKVYNSCQKWTFGTQSAIFNVTHHFSSKAWSRPSSGTVPILIEVQGSATLHGNTVPIHHYYNYFNYKESVEPFSFETPSGIVCQGRAVDRPFPSAPSHIKFSGENIDHRDGTVRYVEEIFDSDKNLVVMRTQAPQDMGTSGGMNHFTYIRDYVTGLSYKIDNQMQFCTTVNITDDTPLPFDFVTTSGKVQQLSPAQFFYNSGTKYDYIGQRIARGITADVWVTKTTFITDPTTEVVIEWYFAKEDTASWNDGSKYFTDGKYRIPLRFRAWSGTSTDSIDMNIYHVDYTNIMYGVLDIRPCYPDKQSNYFQLVVDGAKESVMNTNLEMFKWSTVKLIADAAKVRDIRIVDLQVYYDQNDAIIEFELLDAPPYAGDISGTPPPTVTLQQATLNLQTAVNGGSFYVNVFNSTTNSISQPLPVRKSKSVSSNNQGGSSSSDDGYSAGAMAGLGIAMVIVGGGGGGAGAYFLLK